MNLLDATTIADKVSDGGFMFILGVLVVFFGMIVIVLCIQLIGSIIHKFFDREKKSKKTENVEIPSTNESEEIPDEVKAAIIAAVSMYYFNTTKKCDFIVKKIKKL